MNAQPSLRDEVLQLNRRWMDAYVRRDSEFLQQHLAEDYISTFPDGSTLDKPGEIEALHSGAIALAAMTPREMDARIYGDAAILTGRSTIRANVHGQETSGDFRFTDVWVRSGQRWWAVASQVTPIVEPGAASARDAH